MADFPDTLGTVGVVITSPTPPSAGSNGLLWYDTVNQALFVSQNGSWIPISGGGVGIPEIHVGPFPPTGTETLWLDTSSGGVPVINVPVGSSWSPIINGGVF